MFNNGLGDTSNNDTVEIYPDTVQPGFESHESSKMFAFCISKL